MISVFTLYVFIVLDQVLSQYKPNKTKSSEYRQQPQLGPACSVAWSRAGVARWFQLACPRKLRHHSLVTCPPVNMGKGQGKIYILYTIMIENSEFLHILQENDF